MPVMNSKVCIIGTLLSTNKQKVAVWKSRKQPRHTDSKHAIVRAFKVMNSPSNAGVLQISLRYERESVHMVTYIEYNCRLLVYACVVWEYLVIITVKVRSMHTLSPFQPIFN